MKTKIEEVRNYFKAKILNGDFEVVKIMEYVIKIKVDNEYIFYIWIANKRPGIGTQPSWHSTMIIEYSEKEKDQLWVTIKPLLDQHEIEIGWAKKEARYNQLKKELGYA